MSTVRYNVEIAYFTTGNPGTGIANAKRHSDNWLKGAMSGVERLTGKFNSMFDAVATTMVSSLATASVAATAVLATGMAKAVQESVRFNSEMEDARISMASIFAANGMGVLKGDDAAGISAFTRGMRLANTTLIDMRKHAALLPGEFRDLQNIMTTISPTAAQMGMDASGTEDMAARIMVAGEILGVRQEVAAREAGMILAGTYRHNMPLGNKLGLGDAKTFNALSAQDRLKVFNQKLNAINTEESREAIGGTWHAVSSTTKDRLRQGLGDAGRPVFEYLKGRLKDFNTMALSDRAIDFVQNLGTGIINAFNEAELFIHRWSYPLGYFLKTLGNGIRHSFGFLEKFHLDARIKDFLMDDAAFAKMASLAKTMLALRAGSGALGGAAAMVPGGIKMMEYMGVGAAEFAAAAPFAAAAIVALGVGTYGAVHAITDSSSMFHEEALNYLHKIMGNLRVTGNGLEKLGKSLEPVADALGVGFLYAAERVTGWLEALTWAANGLVDGFKNLSDWVVDLIGYTAKPKPPPEPDFMKELHDDVAKNYAETFGQTWKSVKSMDAFLDEKGKDLPAPQHTTHIHKVEIKVDGNEDPNRVAKNLFDIIKDLGKNPITSPDDPNARIRNGRSD